MAASRIRSLDEAVSLIPDGAAVALGGLMLYNKPMALIRALVKRRVKNLTVICGAPSTLDADLLIGGGCVSTVILQSLTVERVGPIAPRFRDFAQRGELEIVDCDQGMINAGLRAAKFGVPSLPTVAGVGGEFVRVAPNWLKEVQDPFTGQKLLAVRAMKPDFALVHAAISDEEGHAQQMASPINDDLLCGASTHTIVTTEQIVPPKVIQQNPHRTFTWAHKVAAVVEAPFGAHPLGTHGRYPWDGSHVKEYMSLARTSDGYQEYVDKYVFTPDGLPGYLNVTGWERLMLLREEMGTFL